jgi:exodeoxyribonuclease VII large subunit
VITGIGHEKDNSVVDLVAHTRLKTPTAVAEFLIGSVARFELNLSEAEAAFMQKVHQIIDESQLRLDRLSRTAGPLIRQKISNSQQALSQKLWRTEHFIKISVNNNEHYLERKEEEIRRKIAQYFSAKNKQSELLSNVVLTRLKLLIPAKLEDLNRNQALFIHSVQKRILQEKHIMEMLAQEAFLKDPQRILARGYSLTSLNGKIIKGIEKVNIGDRIKTTLQNGTIHSQVFYKN